ncbi:dephospho-CoA kinase [Georgenia sp. 311]|uniref:dephospho-CoA kinase n=1 Tax=Georgenia sp. 311 TaxID=2585134 RepID=UPI0011127D50|nr:dephospho-CoA kinase [Georgenia sp. 311]TNC17403.1 dephospho-CoA kinase [Georgenia sp. 311]
MTRIGLTGGIGAGKSTVARELARLGALVVDADAIAREVVAPGTPGLAAVVAEFGDSVLAPDGSLDRAALGRVVFADPAARARLEAITHPLIGAESARRTAAAPPGTVVVHDVPLIVERGLAAQYDLVVVVGADEEVRIDRLVRDRGMTREEALARVRAQATDAQRRAVADVWLDNSGTREELLERVRELWRERLAR